MRVLAVCAALLLILGCTSTDEHATDNPVLDLGEPYWPDHGGPLTVYEFRENTPAIDPRSPAAQDGFEWASVDLEMCPLRPGFEGWHVKVGDGLYDMAISADPERSYPIRPEGRLEPALSPNSRTDDCPRGWATFLVPASQPAQAVVFIPSVRAPDPEWTL